MGTNIEWTDATWNPVSGCTRASEGCDNCYAVVMTKRLEAMGNQKYAGLVNIGKNHFNGVVKTHDDALHIPLRWRKPRRIFVNSMSDLFHKDVPFAFIDKVFAIMALCPQHTFQILTKRPERMAEYFNEGAFELGHNSVLGEIEELIEDTDYRLYEFLYDNAYAAGYLRAYGISDTGEYGTQIDRWPLPNVWLGTSVENAEQLWRIDELRSVPAAVRFLSIEPLIGDLGTVNLDGIDWVIGGGESGPNARPMKPAWARSLRDQCVAAGVPFFFKQWGEWAPAFSAPAIRAGNYDYIKRVGKKRAGRILDGREWNEFPQVAR